MIPVVLIALALALYIAHALGHRRGYRAGAHDQFDADVLGVTRTLRTINELVPLNGDARGKVGELMVELEAMCEVRAPAARQNGHARLPERAR